MQCNIILYSVEGYFLTFTKRDRGYFFQGKNGSTGSIYPQGIAIRNGSGLFAFPAGELNNGETSLQGCLRQFVEKCGNSCFFSYLPLNEPKSLLTIDTITIDNYSYPILEAEINRNPDYYTLYLEFSLEDLRQIEAIISNINLEDSMNAKSEIIDGKFETYEAIYIEYPFCPLDNELASAELWQVQDQISEIRSLQYNPTTECYFDMIVYLANTVLNKNIPYCVSYSYLQS